MKTTEEEFVACIEASKCILEDNPLLSILKLVRASRPISIRGSIDLGIDTKSVGIKFIFNQEYLKKDEQLEFDF
jgi:hypothetical protein